MTQLNIIRYTGNKHITLVADSKKNEILKDTVQLTSKVEEAEKLETIFLDTLSKSLPSEEITLTFVDFKGFSKMGTEQLLKLYEKTEKMLGAHEMIEQVLIKRNALSLSEEQEEETPETVKETPSREYKKCMTEECLQARLAEARTHYRQFCKFTCTKTKTEEYGVIRSARLDKRSGFIQYRIEIIAAPSHDEPYEYTGKIYGKGDDSKDLTIFEEKPEELVFAEPKKEENTEVAE